MWCAVRVIYFWLIMGLDTGTCLGKCEPSAENFGVSQEVGGVAPRRTDDRFSWVCCCAEMYIYGVPRDPANIPEQRAHLPWCSCRVGYKRPWGASLRNRGWDTMRSTICGTDAAAGREHAEQLDILRTLRSSALGLL